MICPRHEEARKVAAIVREELKTEGAIGAADYVVTVLRRMDLGSESFRQAGVESISDAAWRAQINLGASSSPSKLEAATQRPKDVGSLAAQQAEISHDVEMER
jgi:hypothetical protein